MSIIDQFSMNVFKFRKSNMRLANTLILLLIFNLSFGLHASSMETITIDGNLCVADRVLVKFNKVELIKYFSEVESVSKDQIKKALGLPDEAIIEDSGFILFQKANKTYTSKYPKFPFNLDSFQIVQLNHSVGVAHCLDALAENSLLEYVEVDGVGDGGDIVPNDPNFPLQYHHNNIQSPKAWEITQGSSDVIVAILDTGVTTTLSEFQGRVVPGFDFVNNDSDPTDDHGHGTRIAGVMGATANNNVRVAGVNWHCKIMPVKVLDEENLGRYSDWISGINFAVANGAHVINLSSGGGSNSTSLSNTVRNAINSGVIFITITHNDGKNNIRLPGRIEEAITVGSSEASDVWSDFSNYGSRIDIVAPGRTIYSVSNDGGIRSATGTSYSAPQVAGVAALLLSIIPDMNQETVHTLLRLGADDQVGDSKDTAGFDIYHGWGRLNAYQSLQLITTKIKKIELMADQSVNMTWDSPANANNKRPYGIQYSTDLMNWTDIVTPQNIDYTTNGETKWFDNGSETSAISDTVKNRFYRIYIRSLN